MPLSAKQAQFLIGIGVTGVVANYSALPTANTVSDQFYWCEAAQGTLWLPGSVGGTYYSAGMYYSNGISWEYMAVPYQATQSDVNAGIITDQFVSPYTFENALKWSTKEDSIVAAALTKIDDVNVTAVLGGTPTTALLQAVSLTLGWMGQLSPSRGGTGASAFTSGSIIFAGTSGVYTQDNSNLFWDNTNDILYVGANSGAFTNSRAHFQGNINSYSQINTINLNSGGSASTDFIATANNGTDSANYVDFGVNSSGYNDAAFTIVGPNDAYLYVNGGNLAIGTQSAKDLLFHTGGTLVANTRMKITSSGQVLVNTTTAIPGSLGILRIGQGTATVDIGERSSGIAAIWFNASTPSTTNYAYQGNGTINTLNAASSLNLAIAGSTKFTVSTGAIMATPSATSSGSAAVFTFTSPASTGLTASTEVNGFVYSLTTNRQWSTGALSTQREFFISNPTYRFVGASVITNAATLAIAGAPIAGTNATITNTYALWVQAGISRFDGGISMPAGASSSSVKVGGVLIDFITDAGNSGTTETDIYSYTTGASILGANGDKIDSIYGGIFVSSGTATRQMKVYFGGTAIFDSGALSISGSAAWSLFVMIIRVSATVIRYSVALQTQGAALSAYCSAGELTGLTLSNTNILKITGTAAGVGAATNDIVAKLGTIQWKSAA